MSTLSIIHVLSSFGMGGLERVALDLASGQRDAGHRVLTVSLASGGGGPLAREFRDADLEIEDVPVKPSGFDISVPFRLARLFRKRRADIVHTHNPQPLVMAAAPARAVGAAVIHTKHGVNPARGRQQMMRRAAARLLGRFVAVSDATAATARDQRECSADKITVVTNGINTDRFHANPTARVSIREELGLTPDDFLGLTVGRLWPEKGHMFLIEGLKPMLDEGGAVLAIAGDGPERENLTHFIADLRLEGVVRLLGNRRDVPDLVAASDVFFLSSVREGLPLVICEAMAGGLPVIATAVGGIPTVVVEGETGLLVDYDDQVALLERTRRLAADPDLRARLGAAGRQRSLARYSRQRMVTDYDTIYLEALGR